MQIPRGSFRELKKGILLKFLLKSLKEDSFTGYCKIVAREATALLVLDGGKIILAESGDHFGDVAVAAIGHFEDVEIDAVLHDLNPAQLQLAIEFNRPARVGMISEPQLREQSVGAGSVRAPPEIPRRPDKTKPGPTNERAKEQALSHGSEEKAREKIPEARQKRSEPKGGEESSLLLQELEALDTMDIDGIAERFKENCRKMIEKLDLEYLLDSEQEKGDS